MKVQTVNDLLILARVHVASAAMDSSARLCLADAVTAYGEGRLDHAAVRALKSLRYSLGILHPDYARAEKVAQHVTQAVQRAA